MSPVSAQPSVSPRILGGGGGVVVVPNDPLLNPDSPEARAYAELQRERRRIERELRILKRKHFGSIRQAEQREIGLRKLRKFTSPSAIMVMTELFDDEKDDVRQTILDHFTTLGSTLAAPTLAWEAVHGEAEWYRKIACEQLVTTLNNLGEGEVDPMPMVRGVVAKGLTSEDDSAAVAAGRAAHALKLFEFIPLMASAQAAQRGSGNDRTGDLGWIMIGRQQTFVADLQPVVSNSAVAFDPQIGVASDGVLLRVHDAVVTAYRSEVHRTLVDMTTDAWGRPTGSLGYNAGAWHDWYAKEFVPHMESLASKADGQEHASDLPESGEHPDDP